MLQKGSNSWNKDACQYNGKVFNSTFSNILYCRIDKSFWKDDLVSSTIKDIFDVSNASYKAIFHTSVLINTCHGCHRHVNKKLSVYIDGSTHLICLLMFNEIPTYIPGHLFGEFITEFFLSWNTIKRPWEVGCHIFANHSPFWN